ncbi:hypothetical protein GOP47_0002477 [Adiantum capillus-veneris]|uniref:VASt domain-containing protein n=1 Tax=Adiantum capillus-veneris TaxID=13818 RepID=A0A9D4ZP83_ADICA|nr:hypothetical protein GOP47_0002477 [Adiantum capillus-veneris]
MEGDQLGRSPLVQHRNSLDEQREPILPAGLDSILDDDDDFELTFSLDVQQRAAAESLARSRQVLRSEEYRQLFHLPPEEVLIQDFNCALQKKILLQGHMYLFEHYVCFYSNIFGYEKKKIIVLKDVTSVRKARTAGLFPNAIEIVAWGKKSFFASFLSRDEAYRLIVEGWSRHSRNAIMDSETQSNSSVPITHHMQAAQEQHDVCVSESSFESRDNAEVPSEHTVEADITGGNDGEVNDVDATEVGLPPVDSSSSSETTDANISEGLPSKGGNFWEVEDEDAPNVPQQYKTVLECELPVDVREFFQYFFSDDSIKFCESFHKRCGDEGFQCTNWAKDQHFGHVRDVSFRHPVKVYFGPKASNCQEVQRYRVYQNNHLIVETSQQMNDIPYGDYFRVEGRWDVVPVMDKATPHCAVHVFVDVSFSKKTVWKGKIEQGTHDECKDVYATWLAEAHRLLQEKGLLNNKQTREAVKSKPKRKLDLERGQTQGHVKISKNINKSLSSQTTRSSQSKQPLQVQPSMSTTMFQHLPQHFSLANLTSVGQGKLLIIICMMVVFLLIQMGLIISLSRSTKIQYIPLNQPRWGECHDSLSRHCGRQDVALLQQSTQLMWEEINIAEARLKALQHSLDLLRINLNLAEKIPSPATG